MLKVPKILFFTTGASVLLSVYFLLSERGILTYIAQKREITKLEQRIKDLEEENNKLSNRIELIKKGDREYIEFILRKKGWVKKGEKVMKIEE
jgi:cell division protein FtsB